MHVCAYFGEGGGGVGVWSVFACEYGDQAVGAMDVFLYCGNPEEWGLVSLWSL
jgi:hypothetical protein